MFEESCWQQCTSAHLNFHSVYCAQTLLFFLVVMTEPGLGVYLAPVDEVSTGYLTVCAPGTYSSRVAVVMLHPPGRCCAPGARDTADTGTEIRSSLILGENEAEGSRPVWATYCRRCLNAVTHPSHSHTVSFRCWSWLVLWRERMGRACILNRGNG